MARPQFKIRWRWEDEPDKWRDYQSTHTRQTAVFPTSEDAQGFATAMRTEYLQEYWAKYRVKPVGMDVEVVPYEEGV